MIGGIDNTGVHLIETDPSGMLYEWKAYAIGRGGVVANKIFKQKWKENMSEKEAVKLTLDIIMKTEKEKKESAIDIAIIRKDGKFIKLTEEDMKGYLK